MTGLNLQDFSVSGVHLNSPTHLHSAALSCIHFQWICWWNHSEMCVPGHILWKVLHRKKSFWRTFSSCSWSGSITFIGSIYPLTLDAAANCLPEVRADALLFPLLIFSFCFPVKSYNIDFSIDLIPLTKTWFTHTHTQSHSVMYIWLHLSLCALVIKHSTFIQITNTLMFIICSFCLLFEYQWAYQWISMTGNQHTGHACTSTIVFHVQGTVSSPFPGSQTAGGIPSSFIPNTKP